MRWYSVGVADGSGAQAVMNAAMAARADFMTQILHEGTAKVTAAERVRMLSSASMKKAALFLVGLLSGAAAPALSASLSVTIVDGTGAPLQDAVAWVVPRGAAPAGAKPQAAVQQIDKAFVPLVTVVQANTLVQFPNRDEVRHHVYSFSPAKVFEIKLYAGTQAPPVLFDKPGEVILGCNIHDHMIAYIYVVESPYFGKSGREGRVRFENLPAGDYDVRAWHYAQAAPLASQPLTLRRDEAATASVTAALRPMPPRPPRQ
jgi:plastocyanin